MNRTVLVPLVVAATAGLALAAWAAPAQAEPPSQGCPHGYDHLEVAPLTAAGYKVPALVDSPTQSISFGNKPGNGNGWVCGVPLGNQQFDGHQIYNFMDDSLQVG